MPLRALWKQCIARGRGPGACDSSGVRQSICPLPPSARGKNIVASRCLYLVQIIHRCCILQRILLGIHLLSAGEILSAGCIAGARVMQPGIITLPRYATSRCWSKRCRRCYHFWAGRHRRRKSKRESLRRRTLPHTSRSPHHAAARTTRWRAGGKSTAQEERTCLARRSSAKY